MKVPLRINWLSENNLLEKAAAILDYVVLPGSATSEGVDLLAKSGQSSPVTLTWQFDSLLFDLSQLAQLGFEIGSVGRMEQAIADKEMGDAYDANRAMADRYDNCQCYRCTGKTLRDDDADREEADRHGYYDSKGRWTT